MLATYLSDVLPFRFSIKPELPRDGFLFGNENGPWSTTRVTAAFTRQTQSKLGFRLTMRDYRHISIAMDRKFIRGYDLELDEEDEDAEAEYLDNAHDLMSAHPTVVATNRYGRLAGLLRRLTPESIDVFRAISDKWQAWLGLVSRIRPHEVRKPVQQSEREVMNNEDKLWKGMRHLYGAGAEWRGKQKEAMMALAEGVSPLFIILPTGGGKSLAFLLPALFEGKGTSVVITPLVALADDIYRRCREKRIDVCQFGKGPPRAAKIVIAVCETAITKTFADFVLSIFVQDRLERIIYDEIHKVATDVSYRPKLERLRLLDLPVQYVGLTATCPPSLLPKIEQALVFKDVTVIRDVVYKPKFGYGVTSYDDEDYAEGAMRYVKEALMELETGEKVMLQLMWSLI